MIRFQLHGWGLYWIFFEWSSPLYSLNSGVPRPRFLGNSRLYRRTSFICLGSHPISRALEKGSGACRLTKCAFVQRIDRHPCSSQTHLKNERTDLKWRGLDPPYGKTCAFTALDLINTFWVSAILSCHTGIERLMFAASQCYFWSHGPVGAEYVGCRAR